MHIHNNHSLYETNLYTYPMEACLRKVLSIIALLITFRLNVYVENIQLYELNCKISAMSQSGLKHLLDQKQSNEIRRTNFEFC